MVVSIIGAQADGPLNPRALPCYTNRMPPDNPGSLNARALRAWCIVLFCARELLSFPHAQSRAVQSRNCVLLFEALFQERLNVLVHLLSSGFVVMQSHALADALVVRRKRLVRLFA